MRFLAVFVLGGALLLNGGCQSWGNFWFLPFSVDLSSIGGSNYSLSNAIYADFNIAADLTSLTANTTIGSTACTGAVQVSKDNFQTCISLKAMSLTNDGKRLAVYPIPAYLPNTTYRLKITTTAKSYQGASLADEQVSAAFTTKDVGKWVFTGNFTSAQLSYATINSTTGNLGTFSTVSNGSLTIPLAMDPGGRVLVSSNNAGTALNYSSINQTTGVPSAGTSYSDPNATFNRGFVYHPSLATLYGAANNATITKYSIDMNTGIPSAATSLSLPGSAPSGIGIHPGGKFAYVSSSGNDQIYAVQIDQTSGGIAGLIGQTATGGVYPLTPVIELTGSYLYSANNTSQTLCYYSINQATGALTLQSGSLAVGNNPQGATVDPTGRFVYIVNTSGPSISVFSINTATGAPTAVQTLAVANFPTFIAIEGSGRYAVISYGSTTNQVGSYSINQQTGALTQINLQSATNAQGIAIY